MQWKRVLVSLAPAAVACGAGNPISVHGAWLCSNDGCAWASVRDMSEFDAKNHWLIDPCKDQPWVNLVVLSFVNPLKLLHKTTDSANLNGVPRGMTAEVVNHPHGPICPHVGHPQDASQLEHHRAAGCVVIRCLAAATAVHVRRDDAHLSGQGRPETFSRGPLADMNRCRSTLECPKLRSCLSSQSIASRLRCVPCIRVPGLRQS